MGIWNIGLVAPRLLLSYERLFDCWKDRMSKPLSEMSKEELIALFEALTIKKASLEARRAELDHQLKLKNSNTGKSPSG